MADKSTDHDGLFDFADKPANAPEFSVSQISQALKRTVEDKFGVVRVRGEISGFRGRQASGHAYFSLKDEKSKLDAVVWRGVYDRLKVKPEDGLEVIAIGRMTTYPGRSSYQLVIDALEPTGLGALMALLEERRKKFAAEGLFDPARKKPLPFLPRRIGVVTSEQGSVIRDILHRIADRFPVPVLIWPVRVQGQGSEKEIAAAIEGFNAMKEGEAPDVLIIARGGGSIEDLWSFNDEGVVRAAAASRIPLVSAIGHETDWTLLDQVADLRAPTPTAAAELTVPVRARELERLDGAQARLKTRINRDLEARKKDIGWLGQRLKRPEDQLGIISQRLDYASAALAQAIKQELSAAQNRLAKLVIKPQLLQNLITNTRLKLSLQERELGRALDVMSAAKRQALERLGLPRLGAALARHYRERRSLLEKQSARLTPNRALQSLSVQSQALGKLSSRLSQRFSEGHARRVQMLQHHQNLLQAYSHESVLSRGFALVRTEDGQVINSVKTLDESAAFVIAVKDGTRQAQLLRAPKSGKISGPSPRRATSTDEAQGQGELF